MSQNDQNEHSAESTLISTIKAQLAPVSYLRALPLFGAILCTEHRQCYTPQNIRNHLNREHGVKRQLWQRIEEWIREQKVHQSVSRPPDHILLIPGLAHHDGFICNGVRCTYRTTSRGYIARHVSKKHQVESRRRQREQGLYSPVILQTLFTSKPDLFIVTLEHTNSTTISPDQAGIVKPTISASLQYKVSEHGLNIASELAARVRQAIDTHQATYQQVGEPQHVSEITPWLRLSRFSQHLAGIDSKPLASAAVVPSQPDDDLRLFLIAASVSRVLEQAYDRINSLHHVDARTLHTFQLGTVRQRPFQQLQNRQSLRKYIQLFQSLMCYLIRAVEGHLGRDMFKVTPEQSRSLEAALTTVSQMMEEFNHAVFDHRRKSKRSKQSSPGHRSRGESDEDTDNEPHHDDPADVSRQLGAIEAKLDSHILQLAAALIQHRAHEIFDSALTSFCAVRSTIVHRQDDSISYMHENQVGGMLSMLVYDCQLIILQKAHQLVEDEGVFEDFGEALQQLCSAWIVNNTRGPFGTLNHWRLYVMAVSKNTVPPALIIWDDDGTTLTYGSVRYSLQDLGTELAYSYRASRDILYNDLLLGFPDVPTYPLHEIRDNWSAQRPGHSFVDDPRNSVLWEGHQHWLTDRIARSAHWINTVFHTEHVDQQQPRAWPFRSQFARQYQLAVIKFLEHGAHFVHKGSGMPGRRVEFGGLRWRNVGTALRSLFCHSGYLLFMLSYDKSQSRTHASRYPVRVIHPLMAQLLVQFLVLVQRFRLLLSDDVGIPPRVGDYLWSDDNQPWPEDRFTRVLLRVSRQSLGFAVNPRSWRQMAVGIAVKKFAGQQYPVDQDLPGDLDDDNGGEPLVADGITVPAVFHAQTAHGSRTGNQVYGTTINYSAGLTDAGLQTYMWASKLWWSLYEHVLRDLPVHKRPRPISSSDTMPPLLKKVAHRIRAPRHLRRWGSETVLHALRRLYRDPHAQFRSPVQQDMVEAIAGRYAEVIIVLPTGAGKSLTFMIPPLLPQAGTTVVIVPLVALKQDIVRRCWDAKIDYGLWDAHGDPERFVGCPLLFASVEQAVREPFRRFLARLDANQQLDGVQFDEAHLIITAYYRPTMALVRGLRQFRCPIVCLSATLPPLMMGEFQQRMLLDQPRIVRTTTFRTDLHYDFHRQSRAGSFDEYMLQGVQGMLERIAADEQARMIVYVQQRDEARRMAELVGCECYYSDSGTREEKEQVMGRWRDGVHRVIYATSAFGMGVDYAHVRVVVHQGLPRDAIGFAQEVGRLGRDGQGGSSHVILPHSWQPITESTWHEQRFSTPLAERVMQRYTSRSRCLWATLSRFLDGADQMRYCESTSDTEQLCGICRVRGAFQAKNEADETAYWDSKVVADDEQTPEHVQSLEERLEAGNESADETEADAQEQDWDNWQQGGQRLRQSVRRTEEAREAYVERCQRWRGTCFICRLLGPGMGADHELDGCRSSRKGAFFRAKSQMKRQGRGGWMADHVACWSCGQLPSLCGGQQGSRGCEFRDMVIPAAWAIFHAPNLWGQTLQEISGVVGGFVDELTWLRWVGTECEVFGERGIHGVRMLGWVLEQMEVGELAER